MARGSLCFVYDTVRDPCTYLTGVKPTKAKRHS
jgi:hypothetical protein